LGFTSLTGAAEAGAEGAAGAAADFLGAILFALTEELVEDILNALDMIVTYRGHVNRFAYMRLDPPAEAIADKTMLTEVLLVMAAMMVAAVGQWILFDQKVPVFQSLDSKIKHEWVGRIIGSASQIGIILFWLFEGVNSIWGQSLVLGHALHDTLHMLAYETDVTAYIHHLVLFTVFGLMKLTMTPAQAESAALATVVLESTSPILSLTWLLKQGGLSGHPSFKFVSGFAAGFFGVMRCGVFPWVMAKKMDRVTALVALPFLMLNLYWFWKILKMLKKVLDKKEVSFSSTEQSHEA
jgi:hypothetical protein